jgi:hypothetical protein
MADGAHTRGLASGMLLLVLGAWAAIVPFIGDYMDFAYTPTSTWTSGRGWYELAPGAAAVVGGLLLLFSASRAVASLEDLATARVAGPAPGPGSLIAEEPESRQVVECYELVGGWPRRNECWPRRWMRRRTCGRHCAGSDLGGTRRHLLSATPPLRNGRPGGCGLTRGTRCGCRTRGDRRGACAWLGRGRCAVVADGSRRAPGRRSERRGRWSVRR